MRGILPIYLLLAGAGAGLAQETFVVPNGNANVEGNSSTSDPFTSSTFRMQMVFDASQFAIPAGASGRINAISFRIDGASGGTSVILLPEEVLLRRSLRWTGRLNYAA